MRYKAIIFDLDGVICYTDKYHYLSWKKIANELGVNFDEQLNNSLRGVSRFESLDIILTTYQGELSNEEKLYYADKKNSIYRKFLEGMTAKDIAPQVKDTMDKIREKGLKLAIGSSSKNTKYILKQLDLENYFDAISDGNNIVKSKPDPEVFLKASEFLGIDPQYCLVVEDAKSGIYAALAASMDCAAIGDGTKYNIANYNLDNFSDLLNII